MLRIVLSGWFVLGAAVAGAAEQEKAPEAEPAATAGGAITEALCRPVSLDFEKTSLLTVVAYLKDTCGVEVLLDEAAIEEEGIDPYTPVSIRVSKLPLRSALRWMLRDLGLTFMVDDEFLLITSLTRAEARRFTRVYPLGDLLSRPEDDAESAEELKRLAELIRSATQSSSWRKVGGPCAVSPAELPGVRALVVTQTWQGHEEVAGLLESLRRVVRQPGEGRTRGMIYLVPDTPATKAVYESLERPVSFDFDEAPLETAAMYLAKMAGVNVLVDRRALEDVGLSGDTPVTLRVKDVPLKSALEHLLRPLDLTCVIHHDSLLITTPEEGERQLTVAVYPVGDLIGRRDDAEARRRDLKALGGVITSIVHPHAWDTVGGPGSVAPLTVAGVDMLMVAQTREVLHEIAALVDAFRFVAEESAKDETPAQVLLYDGRFEKNPPAAAIEAALDKPAEFQVIETPLEDVIEYVSRSYEINCVLDLRALSDVGIAEDTPITRQAKGVSLRGALRLMLRDLGLTYVIRGGALVITTPEMAEYKLTIGFYPVSDLIGTGDATAERFERLCTVISNCTDATMWEHFGGPGRIALAPLEEVDALVVAQTQQIHEEIAGLLEALRVAGRRAGGERRFEPILLHDGRYQQDPAAEKIRNVLRQKVNFDFDEAPLQDVSDFIWEFYRIPCVLDQKCLDDVGVATDVPVTIHVSGVTLGAALRLMLAQLDLRLTIRDEVLFFTTPEEAATLLVAGVYPVGDLAACLDEEGRPWDDYESLAQVVVAVEPHSWNLAGGPGVALGGTFGRARVLVVSQTLAIHDEIAKLLSDLRATAAEAGPDREPPRRSKTQPREEEPESMSEKRMGDGFF